MVVDDLDKQEAVALLRGEGGHEGGRFSKAVASQVYALVGGNVAHLARAVELMEGEGWGLEGTRGGSEGRRDGGREIRREGKWLVAL